VPSLVRLVWALLVVVGWGHAGVAHAGDPLAFTVESEATPSHGCPSEARPVRVRLRNTGTQIWDPDHRDRLAYHWRDEAGTMVVRDGERTELPRQIVPGRAVEVEARLKFPAEAGTYLLQWRMVRESVRWYPLDDGPQHLVVVSGTGPALAWEIDVGALPVFESGETAKVSVDLRNVGCAAWGAELHDALSYRWLDPSGAVVVAEGRRTPLPSIAPGASARVDAWVEAPARAGAYRLAFEPVREGLTWYGAGAGAEPIDVTVEPGPLQWSVLDAPMVDRLAARSVITVPVRLRNDGTEAWSPRAGHRVSYRWIGADGQPVGEGMRSLLPGPVEPGAVVEVDVRVAAPSEPGSYRWALRPVVEHLRWFGPPASGVVAHDVVVEAPLLAWAVEDVDAPAWFWVGRTHDVTVKVRNTGSGTWSPGTADRLTYRWLDLDGNVVVSEGRRAELDQDVAPGDTAVFRAQVGGPERSGTHVLELAMVREHVAWFGRPGDPAPARSIEVSVLWSSTVLGLGLLLVVLAVIVCWWHPRVRARARERRGWMWPVWVAACVWLAAEAFADLASIELWGTGRIVALSCGALAGGVLAAVGRAARLVGLGTVSILGLLVVADLAYADFFGSLVPLTALAAVDHLTDAGGSVLSLVEPRSLWVLCLPATGVVLAIGTGRAAPARGFGRWAPAILLGALGLPAVLSIASATASDVGRRVFSEVRNAGRFGVVGAHLFQVARMVSDLGGRAPLDPRERAEVEAFYAERSARERDAVFGVARGANVILLQVEAFQHWALDAEIDGERVMPFLHASMTEARVFDAVFDQTAQGRTSDAEYLVLASNHAMAEGALSFLRADAGFVTLAHVLADAGYTTASAHPYRRGFWNRAYLHPRYGFESSSFRRELGRGPEVGWGLADGPFLDRMAVRIESMPEPFFAFLITLSLHHPYDSFPAGLREMELGALEGTQVGNLLHAMRHFDGALARFVGRLRESGLAERTLVVVYGDHVTGIGEGPDVLDVAGVRQWEPSTPALLRRVPVVAWIPGDPGPRGRSDRVGGQIDIGVTILHALGIAAPPSFVGRSLTTGEPFAALPDGGAVGEDRLFAPDELGDGGACYDRPRGSPRPLADCAELVQRARRELAASRAVLDHDLFRSLRP
jgi:phosphoglycerol transferase MdoB-like AlkP superfamily enzyme